MGEEKMRLTTHYGRAGISGTYSAKHNDRNYDLTHSAHINPEKVGQNWTWHVYANSDPFLSFEAAEERFYREYLQPQLDEMNERNIANGHSERVKSMRQFMRSKKYCPEEEIIQIGRLGNTVKPEVLQEIAVRQINWEIERFPQHHVLDMALHVDEEGAPHIHKRGVWLSHEPNGSLKIGQVKALQQMGVERPDMTKPINRWNNAKMTYTKECREHLVELCQEYGLEIITEPKEASRTGLSLTEYKAQQIRSEAQEALREAQTTINDKMAAAERKVAQMTSEALQDVNDRKAEVAALTEKLSNLQTQIAAEELSVAEVEKLKQKPIWSKTDKDNVILTALKGARSDQKIKSLQKNVKLLKNENKALQDVKGEYDKLAQAHDLLQKINRELLTQVNGRRDMTVELNRQWDR